MATPTDKERTEVRSHIHAACAVLDKYPEYHWVEDPLLAVALAVSISHDDPTDQCIADVVGAPQFRRAAS